jgi:hypothetical protein
MKTQQPVWKLVAQLGDRNPVDYGGHFVFVDETGVYNPEAEVWLEPEDDYGKWEVRRYVLEDCTYINGVLSDNKYHPNSPAWFADSIKAIARSCDTTEAAFIDLLTSDDAQNRAIAWHEIGSYHGFDNLDPYPLHLSRAEITERLSCHPYTVQTVNAS